MAFPQQGTELSMDDIGKLKEIIGTNYGNFIPQLPLLHSYTATYGAFKLADLISKIEFTRAPNTIHDKSDKWVHRFLNLSTPLPPLPQPAIVDDDPAFEDISVEKHVELNSAAEPDLDDPPAENPNFTRSPTSEMNTNQSEGLTCSYHTNSKIILHNVFLFLLPKMVNRPLYMRNNCNKFLNTTTIADKISTLNSLSPEKCSPGGYNKILLFLYLYFLYEQVYSACDPISPGTETFTSNIESAFNDMMLPPIFNENKHLETLFLLLTEINAKRARFTWYTFVIMIKQHSTDLIFEIVRKITNLNFYVKLIVSWIETPEDGSKPKTVGHALTIIGTRVDKRGRTTYVIKNSWGTPPNTIDIDLTMFRLPILKGEVSGIYLSFYLPVPNGIDVFDLFEAPIQKVKNNYIDKRPDEFNEELDKYARIIASVRGGRKTRRFKRTKRVRSKKSKKHRNHNVKYT